MSKLPGRRLEQYLQSHKHPFDSLLFARLHEKENSADYAKHQSESQLSKSSSSSSSSHAGDAKPAAPVHTPPPPGYKQDLMGVLNNLYPILFSKSLQERLVNPENGFTVTPFLSAEEKDADTDEFYQGYRDGLDFMGSLVRIVQLPKRSRYVPYTNTNDGGVRSHMVTDLLWGDIVRFLHASTTMSHLDGVLMSSRITRFDIQQQGFDLPLRRVLHDSKARNSGLMGKLILHMKAAESNKLMVLAACQIIGNMFTNHLSGVFAKQSGNLSIHEAWILYVMNLDCAIFYRNGVPKGVLNVDTTVRAQTLAYHQPKKSRNTALKQALKDPKKYTAGPPPAYD